MEPSAPRDNRQEKGAALTTHSLPIDPAEARAMLDRALSDPNQAFGSFFLSRFLGLRVSYEPEKCIVEFDAAKPLFNPQGSLHGGVLATAMDISMGHLLHRTEDAGSTLEMKLQYLRPVTAGIVRCEASFLRKGRSISFLHSQAKDENGELIAYATSTWKLLKTPAR
jgi:uncharacterized protein (TIGR00369 family)